MIQRRSGRRGGRRTERLTLVGRSGCGYCQEKRDFDYKDALTLKRYTTERGKILPRRKTRLCAKHQRHLSNAIKRARTMALLPFVTKVR
ncbi:MAG TPA: 30S ribosomal protein S18 [Patescibacteria group bacterium]|nr:30S ribosomal protein S18 [Patescibacteria group bacterium]